MTIYLFPIFMFGLLVTGIVYLGITQAVEWAKQDALRRRQSDGMPVRPGEVPAQPTVAFNGTHRR